MRNSIIELPDSHWHSKRSNHHRNDIKIIWFETNIVGVVYIYKPSPVKWHYVEDIKFSKLSKLSVNSFVNGERLRNVSTE